MLDRGGEPAPPAICERVLDREAREFLRPYLGYTRATHLDLLHLAPHTGAAPAAIASLRAAEAVCGEAVLREAIAELGWPRFNLGIEVRSLVGVSVGSWLPYWVRPFEAPLLESCAGARRLGTKYLFVAHGGLPPDGTEEADAEDPVPRFRAYNLEHAAALADILAMAPLTAEKVTRILERMDRIVEDFMALFARFSSECAILPGIYGDPSAFAVPRGELLASTRLSCHGPGGKSIGAIPNLTGLEKAYFVKMMQDFKSGARVGTVNEEARRATPTPSTS